LAAHSVAQRKTLQCTITGFSLHFMNSSSSDTLLKFESASLGYGKFTVLSEIDIEVKRGQVVAMMGGSGSGKTTLMRAATRQIVAQSGKVYAFGDDLALLNDQQVRHARQRMGVLFQQGALFTDLNVFENVAFPLREHTDLSEEQILERVLGKLDAVGLRAAAHLQIAEISGGMARRVALARAIVLEPELILYDEPFAGLDPISLGITAQLIRDLTDKLNCASVLITHDVPESFAIADHVYIVGQGKLIGHGAPAELEKSADPYIAQFLHGEPDGPIAFNYPVTPAFNDWLNTQRRS
jgi:phospholipid/cholesterol/gamma-HCH transport system ATP-binding protein